MKRLPLILLLLLPLCYQSCQKCEETKSHFDATRTLSDTAGGMVGDSVASFIFSQDVSRFNDMDCGLSNGIVDVKIVNLTNSTISFPYHVYYNSIISTWDYYGSVVKLAPHDSTTLSKIAQTTGPVDQGTLDVSMTGPVVYE